MRLITICILLLALSCSNNKEAPKDQTPKIDRASLMLALDSIWTAEQEPLRLRDSFMRKFGDESAEFNQQQAIADKNHVINEKKVKNILDTYGWPAEEIIGEQGSLTIANVIQHAPLEVRQQYLPMMKQAVLEKKLQPRFLVRAEDRIATDLGELQIYGGQMKFYPETKTFNVWPIFDPENIDKRRAEIGLGPIAEHLKNRFNFEWNLEEQIQRTKEFERQRETRKNN